MVFEVPVGPEGPQNRPGVAPRGLVEHAEVASSVFGRVASRKVAPKRRNPEHLSGPQRKPAEINRNLRRVKAKSLSWWL